MLDMYFVKAQAIFKLCNGRDILLFSWKGIQLHKTALMHRMNELNEALAWFRASDQQLEGFFASCITLHANYAVINLAL